MSVPTAQTTGSATGPDTAVVVQAGERRSARIESLRAVAALGVLTGHAFGWAHGYAPVVYQGYRHRLLLSGGFGVWLFFALSGYLLFLPFARHFWADGRPLDVRRYVINRALRILPLYYAVVVVYMLVRAHGGTAGQWLRFATFAETYTTAPQVDGPMWSLVVEVEFYLVLPVLAWLIWRAGRRLPTAFAVVGVLAAASFALRLTTVTLHPGSSPSWHYSLPATFFFFTPGLLLALVQIRWRERPSWCRGVLASSDAWILAAAGLWLLVAWRYNLDYLVGVAGFLVIGACSLPLRPGRLRQVLAWRPLAVLGVASYSLYLWHEPMVRWLSERSALHGSYPKLLVASLVVCIPVALASYAVIESPLLRLRRRWDDVRGGVTAPGSREAAPPTMPPPLADAAIASSRTTGRSRRR